MARTTRASAPAPVLSAWHEASRRPWEEGVYQRDAPTGPYACWNGRGWMADASTPAAAARTDVSSRSPPTRWRGLAQPSGERCATCKGHSVVDRGVDPESNDDLIVECPDC